MTSKLPIRNEDRDVAALEDAFNVMRERCHYMQTEVYNYDLKECLNDTWMHKDYIKTCMLGLMSECLEVGQELPWKPWKGYVIDLEELKKKFMEEAVDIFHFIFNLAALYNINGLDLAEEFISKNHTNIHRQESAEISDNPNHEIFYVYNHDKVRS